MVNALRETVYDELLVSIYPDNEAMGREVAETAAAIIGEAISERGVANVILATGNSQLTFLHSLREMPGIFWPAVNVFHMDEYLNLAPDHPARLSFFFRQHLLDHVPIGAFYPVPGRANDVEVACQGYELLLRAHHPVDLCCLGIGENGHLAFNDPPVANFEDQMWVKVAELDEACQHQQVGEGHFASLKDVPTHAITLTIPALRAAKKMLCIVPERRKAEAVRKTLLGPVTTDCPASILRRTRHARLYLDRDSAAEIM